MVKLHDALFHFLTKCGQNEWLCGERFTPLLTSVCLLSQLQPEQLNCGAAHLQHPLALQKPLKATPLYEAPGLSSVAVEDVHNHTVVFLGTSNGWLRKVRQTYC